MNRNVVKDEEEGYLTPGLIKMWVSFFAMILLLVAVVIIMISRKKMTGFWKGISAVFAYLCMIVAGFIIILIVFSGPGS